MKSLAFLALAGLMLAPTVAAAPEAPCGPDDDFSCWTNYVWDRLPCGPDDDFSCWTNYVWDRLPCGPDDDLSCWLE